MKINKLLILIILISLPIFSQNQKYSDNVTYSIDKIKELSSIAVGNQSWVYPSRGNKFVVINMTFKNVSNLDENVDLDDFVLLNFRTKTKHKLEFANTTGIVNFPAKIRFKIKKGKKNRRRMVFIYPENDTPKSLMLFNKEIEL